MSRAGAGTAAGAAAAAAAAAHDAHASPARGLPVSSEEVARAFAGHVESKEKQAEIEAERRKATLERFKKEGKRIEEESWMFAAPRHSLRDIS